MTNKSEDESSVSTSISDTSPTPSSRGSNKNREHEITGKSRKKTAALTPAEQEPYATHAHEIRQNAKQLVNAKIPPSTNRYRSYHDSPATFVSSNSSVRQPWTAGPSSQESYGVGDALSVSQVASMAFNCISHCFTEGYRAASNYYSTYEQEGKAAHNYHQIGRGEDNNSPSSNGVGGVDPLCGYQQQHMERDLPRASSGKGNHQQSDVRVKGEYATVSLPSTYQGGNNVYILK
ncbi:hypothetical protein ACHAW6_010668 [Cyclotella cf. meneghiniana]